MDEEKVQMNKTFYASTVGTFIYTMVATQADLVYVIGVTNYYMSNTTLRCIKEHIMIPHFASMKFTYSTDHKVITKVYTYFDYSRN